jgi:hypothetical protein
MKLNLLGLLGIAFVVLKLCHVIDWSWWLVTMPFWIVPAALLGIVALAFLVTFLSETFGRRR